MILLNDKVLAFFHEHISQCYVEYSDLRSIRRSGDYERLYFATEESALENGDYVIYTAYEDVVLIEAVGNCEEVLREAVERARKTTNKNVRLLARPSFVDRLKWPYAVVRAEDSGYAHHGVYGSVQRVVKAVHSAAHVDLVTKEDVERIASLPRNEWGSLPLVVRFTRNTETIFAARLAGEIVGCLLYTSSHEHYYDIVSVFVHPSFRGKGIGKSLVDAFVGKAVTDGKKPYYGIARSAASAHLAESLRFEKISDAKAEFRIIS